MNLMANEMSYDHPEIAQPSTEELGLLAVALALEKKATKPVLLDLTSQSVFADYFAIFSVDNSRQAVAVAESIRLFFKEAFGLQPLSSDGLESNNWILLDFGGIFVHVFQETSRQYYKLEQLWAKAKIVDVSESQSHLLLESIRNKLQPQS